jgi:ketosteroid isomerase-like protein
MQPEQKAAIEWQLTRINYASAYYMDNGEFEKLIELFTPDALFDRAGLVHHGHEEIREGLQNRPAITTRHLLSYLHYSDVTPDSAAAVVSAITYHGNAAVNGEPVAYATRNGRVLDFHDTYVRTGDGWKIASRVARVVFTPEDWPGNLHATASR